MKRKDEYWVRKRVLGVFMFIEILCLWLWFKAERKAKKIWLEE